MSNIATNIEQSKHLLELGLSPDSADMEYCYINEFNSGLQVKGDINAEVDRRLDIMFGVTHIPAWSLSALLEVMRKLNATITLQIIGNSTFLRIKDNGFIWQKDIHVKDPMDAVYGGMLWLLEQGLIRKEDKK